MNQAQREYLARRINSIEAVKIAEFSYDIPKPVFDNKDKWAMIVDGTAKLRINQFKASNNTPPKAIYWWNIYEYPIIAKVEKGYEKAKALADAKVAPKIEAIKVEATKLRDKAYLGEATELIDALASFKAMKF